MQQLLDRTSLTLEQNTRARNDELSNDSPDHDHVLGAIDEVRPTDSIVLKRKKLSSTVVLLKRILTKNPLVKNRLKSYLFWDAIWHAVKVEVLLVVAGGT